MSRVTTWILAARPPTLAAAVIPVAVGTAIAHAAGGLRWGPALGALIGALFIQIGTNFANDVFDADRGADGADRVGPTRAVAAGLLSRAAMSRAMVLAFGVATLVGAYLTSAAGWPVLVIGVASIASGIAYTGGPWPLAYNGLGDVFVMLFFGFVGVAGTCFVQLGAVPALAWWAAIPVGALTTAILVVNNLRDRVTDRRADKRTLAVRFGRRFVVAEYAALVGAAYVVPLGLAQQGHATLWWPLLSLPLAVALVLEVVRRDGAALNATLRKTALLLLVHGALLTAALARSS